MEVCTYYYLPPIKLDRNAIDKIVIKEIVASPGMINSATNNTIEIKNMAVRAIAPRPPLKLIFSS